MLGWQPEAGIEDDWLEQLRARIDARAIDQTLVRDWLAYECGIRGTKNLLEQVTNAQAVLLYNQIEVWHSNPSLYAVHKAAV